MHKAPVHELEFTVEEQRQTLLSATEAFKIIKEKDAADPREARACIRANKLCFATYCTATQTAINVQEPFFTLQHPAA